MQKVSNVLLPFTGAIVLVVVYLLGIYHVVENNQILVIAGIIGLVVGFIFSLKSNNSSVRIIGLTSNILVLALFIYSWTR